MLTYHFFHEFINFYIPSYCFQSESDDAKGDTDRETDIKISNDQQQPTIYQQDSGQESEPVVDHHESGQILEGNTTPGGPSQQDNDDHESEANVV